MEKNVDKGFAKRFAEVREFFGDNGPSTTIRDFAKQLGQEKREWSFYTWERRGTGRPRGRVPELAEIFEALRSKKVNPRRLAEWVYTGEGERPFGPSNPEATPPPPRGGVPRLTVHRGKDAPEAQPPLVKFVEVLGEKAFATDENAELVLREIRAMLEAAEATGIIKLTKKKLQVLVAALALAGVGRAEAGQHAQPGQLASKPAERASKPGERTPSRKNNEPVRANPGNVMFSGFASRKNARAKTENARTRRTGT